MKNHIVYITMMCCGEVMNEIWEEDKRIACVCQICKKKWTPTPISEPIITYKKFTIIPRGSGKSLTSTLFYETAEKIAAITSMSAMDVLDKVYQLSQTTPYSIYDILSSMYDKALRGEDLDSIIMGLK
jgi:hypothetical protein